jgi:hypothetical protein
MNKYFEEIDCKIENIYEKHYKKNIYKNAEVKYINIDYDNNGNQGLFNKLIYLSGLVRFCLKNINVRVIEPIYKIGVNHHTIDNKGLLFSEIFDIDFFNKKMENIFYMVPRSDVVKYNLDIIELPHKYANLYGWNIEHNEYINKATNLNKISIDDNILIKVLDALRLNKNNIIILKKELAFLGNDYNAIHMRTESDWPGDWNKVSNNSIINFYKQSSIFDCEKKMFFSTGEQHSQIKEGFKQINVTSHTYLSNQLYDLKTAISYTICLLSNIFISHTYSTFSSLITMQRELIYKNDKNYSYNKNCIYRRIDRGLNYKKVVETNKSANTYVKIVNTLTES